MDACRLLRDVDEVRCQDGAGLQRQMGIGTGIADDHAVPRLSNRDGRTGRDDRPFVRDVACLPDRAGLVVNSGVARDDAKCPRHDVTVDMAGVIDGDLAAAVDADRGRRPQRGGPRPSVVALQQAFGFSPAEAKLAADIALGKTLLEIAAQSGVSKETLRSRLKSIFGKTATSRQSELALLLSRIPMGSSR